MSVVLETIDHGESKEDQKINSNFKKLNQDTGNINLVTVGGASVPNVLTAQRRNGIVRLNGSLIANDDIPNNTKIVELAHDFVPYGFCYLFGMLNYHSSFPIVIKQDGLYIMSPLTKSDSIEVSGLTYMGN